VTDQESPAPAALVVYRALDLAGGCGHRL